MIILDTDHLSELQRAGSVTGARLAERLQSEFDQGIATTIISAEEQLRGRLATLHGKSRGIEQVRGYDGLRRLLDFYKAWLVLPFDQAAANIFDGFGSSLVRRVKTMDAKIAAIAIANHATLLSANLRDFRQIPDLVVEDWLLR